MKFRPATWLCVLAGGVALAARGASPSAFDQRYIPAGGVAQRSNTGGILAFRALPAGRIVGLGATTDLHHGLLGAGAWAQEKQAVTPAALEGAWRLASLSYNGLPQDAIGYMVFHGTYYSFVTTRTRPKLTAEISRKPVETLTDAEKMLYIEAYGSMTAAAGTFTIEDGAIHYLREAVRSPHLQGQKEHRKSWFEDSKLIQDFQGGGRRQVYVWERVSGPSAMGRQ